jgi:hypothetical protein
LPGRNFKWPQELKGLSREDALNTVFDYLQNRQLVFLANNFDSSGHFPDESFL